MHEILTLAADLFGVTVDDLTGPRRHRHIVQARQAAAWSLRTCYPTMSMESIGQLLGGRDHSTIVHAIQRAEQLAREDAKYRERLRTLVSGEVVETRPPRRNGDPPDWRAWWVWQSHAGRARVTLAA
jgi:chromosomal replication initiation ATPase DnaA